MSSMGDPLEDRDSPAPHKSPSPEPQGASDPEPDDEAQSTAGAGRRRRKKKGEKPKGNAEGIQMGRKTRTIDPEKVTDFQVVYSAESDQ